MKYCSKCGHELRDEAVVCVGCGCAVEATNPVARTTGYPQCQQEDKVSVGLCILSVLLPIFGVIYWPVKHKETPKRAQACGICGIVAWIFNFIVILSMM